jgi:signal recognition particle receptor subunit beta
MSNYKILFTGPVGAGKTTAISSISDEPPMKTDRLASDMTKNRKKSTTVAMDYGTMKLADGEQIHIYGTPGQERFDFMWQILTKGGIGLVLLLDNSRENPFQDLEFFLKAFSSFIEKTTVVIGITQMDVSNKPSLEEYRLQLRERELNVPVFEVDAREREDVSLLIQSLLYTLDPVINE